MSTTVIVAPGSDIELETAPRSRLPNLQIVSTDQENDADRIQSSQTKLRMISCGVSFFVAGVNDGSLGALLPYVIRTHGLTTAIASSV
jgi:hypothetical protein